jgi:outer membrane protein
MSHAGLRPAHQLLRPASVAQNRRLALQRSKTADGTPARLRLACCCAAIVPFAALAELSNDPMIGAGVRSLPAYDGSATQRLELVPVIRHFGQPWFARSTQGLLEAGARTELLPGLHAGAQLAYESGRKSSGSDFLQGHQVADIGPGASVGLHLEWDHKFGPMPITLLGRLRKHADAELGTQADLRLSAGVFQSGGFSAGVVTQATWADTKATSAYHGIGPQQSVLTGLPVFQPGGGLLHTSLGLLWSVDLGPKWIVVGSLERRKLQGDAGRGPLAEQSSNSYLSAGLAYRY